MKTLAIITARGGSKGLPNKNIKEICGKPLIEWTIKSALETPEIDKVIVSSDCEQIMKVAEKSGANVPFKRPDYLASDTANSIDVILHAIEFIEKKGEQYDFIVLLEPTSPLRKKEDLSNAINLFKENRENADGVISLGEVHLENPFITKKINSNGYVENLIKHDKNISQRQQYPTAYFPYGVIYGIKTKILKEQKTIYTNRSIPFFIERWQNYEIDDIYDFLCVETILNENINKIK